MHAFGAHETMVSLCKARTLRPRARMMFSLSVMDRVDKYRVIQALQYTTKSILGAGNEAASKLFFRVYLINEFYGVHFLCQQSTESDMPKLSLSQEYHLYLLQTTRTSGEHLVVAYRRRKDSHGAATIHRKKEASKAALTFLV